MVGLLDTFKFWGRTLEKQEKDLERELYSKIQTNLILAKRFESNSIVQAYIRQADRPIDLRMEAVMYLVDNNAPFLKPKTDENARQLLVLWGRLLPLWTVYAAPYLRWRRKQPIYDPNLPNLEIVEEKAAALCEFHLIPRGILLVYISYGIEEITPQFTNIMKQQMMMPQGGNNLLFSGEDET